MEPPVVQPAVKKQKPQVLFVLFMKWNTDQNPTGLHLVHSHRIYLWLIKQMRSPCIKLHDVKKSITNITFIVK